MIRKELADLAGVRITTINAWFAEGSGLPNLGSVIQVAQALDVSIDYLAGLTETQTALGSLPDDAQLVDLELMDAVLCAKPKAEDIDKWLAWDPLVFHGMVTVPARFRLVGKEEASRIKDQVYSVLFERFPQLYEGWFRLYKKPLANARKRTLA
jgi:transcriptional regulator with XRE-family HTH domain